MLALIRVTGNENQIRHITLMIYSSRVDSLYMDETHFSKNNLWNKNFRLIIKLLVR